MPNFDPLELKLHFVKHGTEFGAPTDAEYERLAAHFLTAPLRPGVLECTRKCGDIVRYDTATTEYGVLSATLAIRTYFKPRPCSSLPAAAPKLDCHGYSDNVQYFKARCL